VATKKLHSYLNSIQKMDISLSQLIFCTERLTSTQFAIPLKRRNANEFWTILSRLGNNVWHRWFRTEKLEIVMRPDNRSRIVDIDLLPDHILGGMSIFIRKEYSDNLMILQ